MESSPDYINSYYNRLERVKFSVKQLRPFDINEKRILSIGGGGSRYLQESLNELNSNAQPFEVYFQGDNDLTLNLDTIERLPFKKPEDGRRWWFTYDDVISFFNNFEKENSCEITFFSDLPRKGLVHTLIKPFIPKKDLFQSFL